MVDKIVEKEVITTTEPTTPTPTTKKVADYSATYQLIYLIFGVAEGLIGIRFAFRLFGANAVSPIVSFIYSFTDMLMSPFRFIFPTSQAAGAVFDWTALVAILFYVFLSWIVTQVISIFYTKDLSS